MGATHPRLNQVSSSFEEVDHHRSFTYKSNKSSVDDSSGYDPYQHRETISSTQYVVHDSGNNTLNRRYSFNGHDRKGTIGGDSFPGGRRTRKRKNSFDEQEPVDLVAVGRQPNSIKWKRGQLLGRGSFGSVVLGINIETGELMAVKQIPIPVLSPSVDATRYFELKTIERETNLMKAMSFPNIVTYYGVQVRPPTETEEGMLDVFMEYVPGGSIAAILATFGSLEEPVVRQYTRQILLGLEFLHRHDIVHRDIKGGNILVDASGVCKLADFGTSTSIADLMQSKSHPSIQGTVAFMAPEVVRRELQDCKVDIWSVGCTVLEMITGVPPWSEIEDPMARLSRIAAEDAVPSIPDHISPTAKDFLLKCLVRNPKERSSASELLWHPFVSNLDTYSPKSSVTKNGRYFLNISWLVSMHCLS